MGLLLSAAAGLAENRFPKPQFESGYVIPGAPLPAARAFWLEAVDGVVLLGALSLAAWLVLKARSRRGVFLLSVFSLIYFGFWREGCVCSVGGIQNVAAWLLGGAPAPPWSVAAFFILPLVFALLFGRVFCAAVCPLGAIQEMTALGPMRLPRAVTLALGFLPVVYLGMAVLLAGTGAAFVICRYDPFVPFFRFSGDPAVTLAGVGLLLAGIVVARPYCRFLCPYGVLLNVASRFSRRHATITPDACVRCRLCEEACPFDAIRAPVTEAAPESRARDLRRLKGLLVLLPGLVGAGSWLGVGLEEGLAPLHPKVKLEQVLLRGEPDPRRLQADAVEAFRSSGAPQESLAAEAATIRQRIRVGGGWLGGFLGGVFGLALIRASVRRSRAGYEPDRGECLSCGRCYRSCPKEHERLAVLGGGA
jgi:ferredoxin